MVVSPGGALPDSIRPPAPSEGQSWDLKLLLCWLLRSELQLASDGIFLCARLVRTEVGVAVATALRRASATRTARREL
jgi:hypothetical protein